MTIFCVHVLRPGNSADFQSFNGSQSSPLPARIMQDTGPCLNNATQNAVSRMPKNSTESPSSDLFNWTEPVILFAWQIFIFLSIRNAIFHGYQDTESLLSSIANFMRPLFAYASPLVATVFVAGYVLVFLLPAMGKSNRLLLASVDSRLGLAVLAVGSGCAASRQAIAFIS